MQGSGAPIVLNPAMVPGCPPGHMPVAINGRIVLVPMQQVQALNSAPQAQHQLLAAQQALSAAQQQQQQPQQQQQQQQQRPQALQVGQQPGGGGGGGAGVGVGAALAQLHAHQQQQQQQQMMAQQHAALLAAQQRHAQGGIGALQVTGVVAPRPGLGTSAGGSGAAGALVRTLQPGMASQPPQPRFGFTQGQLDCLRSQIMAFKAMKKGATQLDPAVLECIKPPPLPPPPPRPQPVAVQAAPVHHMQAHAPRAATPTGVTHAHAHAPARGRGSGGGVSAASTPSSAAGAPAAFEPPGPLQGRAVRRPQGSLLSLDAPRPGEVLAGEINAPPLAPQPFVHGVAHVLRQVHERRLEGAAAARAAELGAALLEGEARGWARGESGCDAKRDQLLLQLRSLRLRDLQRRLRGEVERHQAEIVAMPDRLYRKFQREAARFRLEAAALASSAVSARLEAQQAAIRQYKQYMQDRASMVKDMRNIRNKGVARVHERLARGAGGKHADDDRSRRLEALRANDFEAYQALLKQQAAAEAGGAAGGDGAGGEGAGGPGVFDHRYREIERFLRETDAYIDKLANKMASVKLQQEITEAVQEAMDRARNQGLDEEGVQEAGNRAAQGVVGHSDLLRRHNTDFGDTQNRYMALAHTIEEFVTAQPAGLRPPNGGCLRDYQMRGLQWMVSLYNNKLNGILADEMGLGKTVQVMALIAYLMEHKNCKGPHLIIVPNAVIVNWKAELATWLPDVKCVYYTGTKAERRAKFQTDVSPRRFHVLVTTYEYIMRDRNLLSRVDWRYIVIDEAQRMKDRKSKLSQDLNHFRTERRLLLTGTPLQNELKELWSLLNLLLPDVFDDKRVFSEWFHEFLEADGRDDDGLRAPKKSMQLDGWLLEKRVLVINRLHQILEPFMLRRQVQDVEGKLPPKVAYTIKCPMTAMQSTIYDWIKATGSLRVNEDMRRAHSKHDWIPLQNKVMEMRKVCNHPLLTYSDWAGGEYECLVRQSGKMVLLDNMLVKLWHTGHRVLLFSTMTRMLDLLETYLNWRVVDPATGAKMVWRRIDGHTTLDDREKAIQEFNRKGSDVFIFLLSIRAAGRGLNLQSSDTVVIYDPDPNPKNEEQAIARSHRIGQTKEVRVFHMEAIAEMTDALAQPLPPRYEFDQGAGTPGRKLYVDSIESLMRNLIQKQKIDMANEIIDAGCFDGQTKNDERRQTLESMLQDSDRSKAASNTAPTPSDLNRMLARSPDELALFAELDRQLEWPGGPLTPQEVPDYLRFTRENVAYAQTINARKPARTGMLAAAARREAGLEAAQAKRKPGRPPRHPGARSGAPAPPPAQVPGPYAPPPAPVASGAWPGETASMGGSMFDGSEGGGDDDEDGEEGAETALVLGEDDDEEEVVGDVAANVDEEFEAELEREEAAGAAGPSTSGGGGGGSSGGGVLGQQQQQHHHGGGGGGELKRAATAAGEDGGGGEEEAGAKRPRLSSGGGGGGAASEGGATTATGDKPRFKFVIKGLKAPGAPPPS